MILFAEIVLNGTGPIAAERVTAYRLRRIKNQGMSGRLGLNLKE
jgi:hypothetical protein